jgi:hypothetical protein
MTNQPVRNATGFWKLSFLRLGDLAKLEMKNAVILARADVTLLRYRFTLAPAHLFLPGVI